jgi:hypothetical protein
MRVRSGHLLRRRAALLLCALAFGTVPLAAHHRFDDYLENRELTIEGDVFQLEYREPHSFVHVIVARRGEGTERWIVEWRGASHLRRQGVTLWTLKPGERVIVTGSPGRIWADRRLRLRAIVRPGDGWNWRDAVE